MAASLEVILSAEGKQLTAAMQKAEKDVQAFNAEVKKTQPVLNNLDKGLNKSASSLGKIPLAAKPATAAISKLGDTLETLRGKLLAKQQLILSEQDPRKIAAFNVQIKELQSEITRVKRIGTEGFDSLGNAVTKAGGSFTGLATGAQKGFSALRLVANIIPGIGLAGLIGLLSEAIIGLFKTSDGFDKASLAAARFGNEIKNIKEGLEGFFSDINFDAEIKKLQNQLKFGEGADVLNFGVDKEESQKIINTANQEIDKIVDRIGQLRTNASLILSKEGRDLLQAFPIDLEIPKEAIDKLKDSDKKIFNEITALATREEIFSKQRNKERQKLQIVDLQEQIKINEKKRKDQEDFIEATIQRAKKLSSFINKTTIRFAPFELDPELTKGEQFNEAIKFIQKALTARSTFELKPQILIENPILLRSQKYFASLAKEADGMLKDLQEEINKLTKRNPILIRAEKVQIEEKERGKQFNDIFGIPQSLQERFPLLDAIKIQAGVTANAINNVLTPAFEGLFNAIKSGENPIKAFFQGIGNAVLQLIQKLIAAAVQALVIQAVLNAAGLGGAAGSTGSIIGKLLGFRAEGGPVFANQPYVVGERGPELFVPQGGGRIIPNNEMNTGLAGIGGGFQNMKLSAVLRGRDIILSNARENRSQNRNV